MPQSYQYGPITIVPDGPDGGGGFYINGQRIDYHDPRLFGSAGHLNTGGMFTTDENPGIGNADQRLSQFPEGWMQVPQAELGGYSGIRDPSQLRWDERFGLLTRAENVTDPESHGGLARIGPILPAALFGGALYAGGAFGAGGLGGSSNPFAGAVAEGSLGADLAGAGAAGATANPFAGATASGSTGSGGLFGAIADGGLSGAIDFIGQNPGQALRAGLGIASAFGGGSSDGGGQGGGGFGGAGPAGPIPQFTPWQFQYQPNQANRAQLDALLRGGY
jgi:hypothetical protein